MFTKTREFSRKAADFNMLLTFKLMKNIHKYTLIYINDLADELSSNTKLFTDDTSLFSVVHNRDSSAAELNNDLTKIKPLGATMENEFQSRS